MTARAWRDLMVIGLPIWDELVAEGLFTPLKSADRALLHLNFVGLVGLPERLIICMPRFGLGDSDPVRWIRRVLAAYFARATRRSREDLLLNLHHKDEAVFREIDALSTLLAAFSDRGLYRRAVAVATRRGSGPIDWAKTLAYCEPLLAAGRPLYPEPFHLERGSLINEVSALQAAVTVRLARRYGVQVPAPLDDEVAGVDLDARLSAARAQADLALLGRERAVTYLAADLRLLETLHAVISGWRQMEGMAGARLHGTTAFELVWEDAVRDLFGDDAAEVELASANWRLLEGESWSDPEPAANRRLDLVIRQGSELILVDAKYHHLFPASRPGWADIVKQIYYAETVARGPDQAIRNVFMLPASGERLALVGRVDVENANRGLPGVEAWTADPGWVFSGYGDGDPARRAGARVALFAARGEVAEMLGNTENLVGV